jgi:hypothetical protein
MTNRRSLQRAKGWSARPWRKGNGEPVLAGQALVTQLFCTFPEQTPGRERVARSLLPGREGSTSWFQTVLT